MVLAISIPDQSNILGSGKLAIFGAKVHVDSFPGDGTTKSFALTQDNAVLGSEVVKVDGVPKVEGTDYTATHELGILKSIDFLQLRQVGQLLMLNICIWIYRLVVLQSSH